MQQQIDDPSQFGQLYDQYVRKIYNYIYYRVHHKETAEDITGTTFMKALENFQSFDPKKGNFSMWIYRIAKNTLTDHYRALKTNLNIDDVWDIRSETEIPKDADTHIQLEKVQKYLRTLKPVQRDIIIMRLWDGLSYIEIADILGKSEASCKMTFSRALKEIRGTETLALLLIIPLIFHP
ncbi:MAG: sigma-70 family RNA polymerase sigma factor [Candidatus Gracilibacteria bacterium]